MLVGLRVARAAPGSKELVETTRPHSGEGALRMPDAGPAPVRCTSLTLIGYGTRRTG